MRYSFWGYIQISQNKRSLLDLNIPKSHDNENEEVEQSEEEMKDEEERISVTDTDKEQHQAIQPEIPQATQSTKPKERREREGNRERIVSKQDMLIKRKVRNQDQGSSLP